MASQATATDEALVALMGEGDQQALSALYDRYRGLVFSLALRVLKDRAESEEVLADVFLQAWRQAASFDRDRGVVPAWLITLCRSRAIDRLRARGRREAAMSVIEKDETERIGRAAASGEPETAADQALKRGRITRALAGLTSSQREAIELAYYGGLSHSEIAARLGEPLGTVKTRIRQAMLALKDSLAGQFES